MGSINDNADEVQNQEVGEELAPQPVTQTEDGERDSGVQGPDAVHALGEELARMFETGSGRLVGVFNHWWNDSSRRTRIRGSRR